MRYWLGGENQAFIQLLSQIERSERRGEGSGELGSEFSRSFPNRARRIWAEVSSPYLKMQHDDMEEFLADESEGDEVDEGHVPINPHYTPPSRSFKSPEERMIEHLKKKNKNMAGKDGSESDDSDDSGNSNGLEVLPKKSYSGDDDDHVDEEDGAEEDDDEEEDEWEKSKRFKSKKSQRAYSDDDDVFLPGKETITGSARKRILDSSDEDSY